MTASVGIPRLTGGGAEKVARLIAAELQAEGDLSRVYIGRGADAALLPGADVRDLAQQRTAGAVPAYWRALKGDAAGAHLLTLGYINLAPVLRVRRPAATVVLRIGNTATPELAGMSAARRLRYLAGLNLAVRAAHRVIVQCRYMADDLARHVPAARGKMVAIYNAVEAALWAHVPSPAPPLDRPYLLCGASNKPQKALDVLIAAWGRSPARDGRRALVLAGVAPHDAKVAAWARAAGLAPGDLVLPGQVALYDWLHHAELAVLPSRYEGFSNFLLEAAAFGKTIVATDCPGGNAELFARYPHAVTVPVDDADALARALAIARTDLGRADIGRDAARALLRDFDQETVMGQYRDALGLAA